MHITNANVVHLFLETQNVRNGDLLCAISIHFFFTVICAIREYLRKGDKRAEMDLAEMKRIVDGT